MTRASHPKYSIKREVWDGKLVSVARYKGRFVSWSPWESAKTTKEIKRKAEERIALLPPPEFGKFYTTDRYADFDSFPYRYVIGVNKKRKKHKYEHYIGFNCSLPREPLKSRLEDYLISLTEKYDISVNNWKILGIYSRVYGGKVNLAGIPYKLLKKQKAQT